MGECVTPCSCDCQPPLLTASGSERTGEQGCFCPRCRGRKPVLCASSLLPQTTLAHNFGWHLLESYPFCLQSLSCDLCGRHRATEPTWHTRTSKPPGNEAQTSFHTPHPLSCLTISQTPAQLSSVRLSYLPALTSLSSTVTGRFLQCAQRLLLKQTLAKLHRGT